MRQYETLRDMRDYSSLRNPESFRTSHNSLRAYHPKAERERSRETSGKHAPVDREQRRIDAHNNRVIQNQKLREMHERETNVTDYAKVGKDFIEQKTKYEMDEAWKDYEKKFTDESGRVIVEVKNSLQFDLRQIEAKLDKMEQKYCKKKAGNPHIREGMQKLKAKLEETIEQAIRELLAYMIEEEHKQNYELRGRVAASISKAVYDIGYGLTEQEVEKLIRETVTDLIQGSLTEHRLDSFIYNKVDMMSRRAK